MEKNHSKRNLIISIVIYILVTVFVVFMGDLGFSMAGGYIVILAIVSVLISIQSYFVRKNKSRRKDQDGVEKEIMRE